MNNNNTTAVENQKLVAEAPAAQPRPAKRSRDYQQISLFKDVNPLDWKIGTGNLKIESAPRPS